MFARRLEAIIRNLGKNDASGHGTAPSNISGTQNPNIQGSSANTISHPVRRSGAPQQTQLTSQSANPVQFKPIGQQSNRTAVSVANRRVILMIKKGGEYKLAQISVANLHCYAFFKELRETYFSLRGLIRSYFSIWRYSHCDFYMVSVKQASLSCDSLLLFEFGSPSNWFSH